MFPILRPALAGFLGTAWLLAALPLWAAAPNPVLQPESFRHYVERFNAGDREIQLNLVPETTMISNAGAWDFLYRCDKLLRAIIAIPCHREATP